MIKRIFDFILAAVLISILALPMLLIAVFIKLVSSGPAIFWTDRIGVNNRMFKMAKFRTMTENAPQLATHLMTDVGKYLVPGAKFLRNSSLDELPQLFNVLKGEMSFVGPRPALFNQDDLMELRTAKGIHTLMPGITGWAQVKGRDELAIQMKVSFDEEYLQRRSLCFDIRILLLTLVKVIKREGVRH